MCLYGVMIGDFFQPIVLKVQLKDSLLGETLFDHFSFSNPCIQKCFFLSSQLSFCVVNINFHVFLFNWNQSFGGQEPLLMFMFLALLVVLIQLVSGNRCPIKYLLNETRNE